MAFGVYAIFTLVSCIVGFSYILFESFKEEAPK